MAGRRRILVVEDEPAIRTGICDMLAFHGHAPVGIERGDDGLEHAMSRAWDLILLDVMLPGLDGFSICEQVRAARPRQAILMLTAKGSEESVLKGFRAGCDDYVPKPFSVAQLMARVEALLRRSAVVPDRSFQVDGLSVDPDSLQASSGQRSTELSPRDVEVLAFLGLHAGQVVTREQLLKEVWGYQRVDGVQTRCVDMHLVKLRRKLESVGRGGSRLIETVRGAGYRVRTGAG